MQRIQNTITQLNKIAIPLKWTFNDACSIVAIDNNASNCDEYSTSDYMDAIVII